MFINCTILYRIGTRSPIQPQSSPSRHVLSPSRPDHYPGIYWCHTQLVVLPILPLNNICSYFCPGLSLHPRGLHHPKSHFPTQTQSRWVVIMHSMSGWLSWQGCRGIPLSMRSIVLGLPDAMQLQRRAVALQLCRPIIVSLCVHPVVSSDPPHWIRMGWIVEQVSQHIHFRISHLHKNTLSIVDSYHCHLKSLPTHQSRKILVCLCRTALQKKR